MWLRRLARGQDAIWRKRASRRPWLGCQAVRQYREPDGWDADPPEAGISINSQPCSRRESVLKRRLSVPARGVFKTPTRRCRVSDCGEWAIIEGVDCGWPVEALQVVEDRGFAANS